MGQKDDGKELVAVLQAAGCHVPQPHPWHALRHTFASHYIMNGGNLIALQQILGHHDVTMTMIYAHLAPSYHAQDMARLSYSSPVADVLPIAKHRRTA
jgi:site-specific recombinase XerD